MPEPKLILQRWHPLARLGLFALVYFASSKLGARLIPEGEHATPMWPSSGVLLTVMLLSRLRHWPVISLTVILVELLACQPDSPSTLARAIAIAAGNVLASCTGAFLLRRHASFRPSLERVRDVLALVGISAMLSTMLSATPAATLMLASQETFSWAAWRSHWRVFWVGDAMGVLLVAPPLLTWATRGLVGWRRAHLLELAALLLALVLTIHFVFHYWKTAGTSVYHPASYLAFPFILWAALRFEVRGTAVAMLALAAVALWNTLEGNGPFATGIPDTATPGDRVLFLQAFLAAVGVSGLLLAAALGEHRHAQEQATRLNRELRQSLDELAAAQQELVRRECRAALGELSACVAHEVRNPLGVIANSVAVLIRSAMPQQNSIARSLLGAMDEEVARLEHFISNLLDFAQPLEPRPLPLPLGAVVDEALEAFLRSEPHAKQVWVKCELDFKLPVAPLDAQLLHVALSNLFTNAMQAMPQGGTLLVELSRELRNGQCQARLAITDTGPGIAPEVLARMFEPFYTTRATGTGLGLAIVRRIIEEAHHGKVEVRSALGQGTTVLIYLPLERAACDAAA